MEGPNTPITDADFSVSLPVALFSVNVLGSLNPSDCAGYGFTISYNGVQEPMDSCYVNGPTVLVPRREMCTSSARPRTCKPMQARW